MGHLAKRFGNTKSKKSTLISLAVVCLLVASCSHAPPEKSKASDQDQAALRVALANAKLREGDPTGALRTLAEAEKIDNTIPGLHHSRAIAYIRKSQIGKAIQSAQRAVALQEDYSAAHNTLGRLYLIQRKFKDAEKHLKLAGRDDLYREAFKAYTNLGIVYYKQRQYKKSLRTFAQAIKSDPNRSCVAYFYRGHIWMKRSKPKIALKNYEKSTRRFCGNFKEAHYAVGLAYLRMKQFHLAKKKFVEINQIYPNTQVAQRAMRKLRAIP